MNDLITSASIGAVRPGAWCSRCFLPSAFEFTLYWLQEDGPHEMGTGTSCPTCEGVGLARVDLAVCVECTAGNHIMCSDSRVSEAESADVRRLFNECHCWRNRHPGFTV